MASWLPETLFEIVGQGPAPSKDYYQLLVTRSQKVGIYREDAKHKISAFKEICIKHLLCARCDTLRKNDSQPVALQDVPNSSCEIAVDQKCLLWDALLAQLGERSALDLGIGSASLMLGVEITKKINSKKIRLLKVIFRWWKISLRSEYRSAKPGETKDSHGAFLENSHLQVQIALIFGARILDYVFNLCEGKFDFLERLSDNLLLSIISYLDLEDIARLSQTSRRFAKLCTCDKLWEKIVLSACDTVTPDMRALAEDMGWRQMFFTNKLQLQRRLRKRRQGQGSHRNSQL